MTIANKYNVGGQRFNFNIPETHDFISLKELFERNGSNNAYIIMAYFINTKGKFGDNPVIATPDYLVNIPSHMTEVMKEMRTDPEVVQAINNAELGFTIYSYENSYGTNYSIQFIDL